MTAQAHVATRIEPLAKAPGSLREIVESDLRRAARLIVTIQDEIDWQIRMATPKGDYHLAIMMPDDPGDRTAMLRRLETFMAWKQASAFCLTVEMAEPDAVYAVGITRRHRVNCLSRINRSPQPWTAANFGPVEWFPEASIDPSLAALLPTGPRPMTPKQVASLEPWFGKTGRFPAVHVPTREVRGI